MRTRLELSARMLPPFLLLGESRRGACISIRHWLIIRDREYRRRLRSDPDLRIGFKKRTVGTRTHVRMVAVLFRSCRCRMSVLRRVLQVPIFPGHDRQLAKTAPHLSRRPRAIALGEMHSALAETMPGWLNSFDACFRPSSTPGSAGCKTTGRTVPTAARTPSGPWWRPGGRSSSGDGPAAWRQCHPRRRCRCLTSTVHSTSFVVRLALPVVLLVRARLRLRLRRRRRRRRRRRPCLSSRSRARSLGGARRFAQKCVCSVALSDSLLSC